MILIISKTNLNENNRFFSLNDPEKLIVWSYKQVLIWVSYYFSRYYVKICYYVMIFINVFE